MKRIVHSRIVHFITVVLFFYAAFVAAAHLHAPEHEQHHAQNCKICIIVHNFVAPELPLPQSQESAFLGSETPLLCLKIFCDTLFQKNFYSQAPPAYLL
jgi:hypothetical protein